MKREVTLKVTVEYDETSFTLDQTASNLKSILQNNTSSELDIQVVSARDYENEEDVPQLVPTKIANEMAINRKIGNETLSVDICDNDVGTRASVCYITEDGNIIDIAGVEIKAKENNKNVNVYVYADAYDEDYTDKYVIRQDDIYKATEE